MILHIDISPSHLCLAFFRLTVEGETKRWAGASERHKNEKKRAYIIFSNEKAIHYAKKHTTDQTLANVACVLMLNIKLRLMLEY